MVKNMLPAGRVRLWALLLLSVAGLGPAPAAGQEAAPAAEPALTRVVTDWRTGLALHGMDPVAYFSDGRPLPGRADLELRFAGAVWRFRNEGNRAAFMANPEVYAPRFGGYDPMAVARGVATPGNPLIWRIFADRLYLFYSPQTRAQFEADPARVIAAGVARWPELQASIDVTGALPAMEMPVAAPPPSGPPML
jgi:hypothetical protein